MPIGTGIDQFLLTSLISISTTAESEFELARVPARPATFSCWLTTNLITLFNRTTCTVTFFYRQQVHLKSSNNSAKLSELTSFCSHINKPWGIFMVTKALNYIPHHSPSFSCSTLNGCSSSCLAHSTTPNLALPSSSNALRRQRRRKEKWGCEMILSKETFLIWS